MKQKIIVAVAGASGAIYAKLLLDALQKLNSQIEKIELLLSDNAKEIWQNELQNRSFNDYLFSQYEKTDFNAPFASGSSLYNTMIICPCSMGTLGRIANGISNDLITRTADVMLKERRKLILVIREMPYNLVHIENMKKITLAGGIICPANPSFYSLPKSIEQLAETVVNRVLDLSGFNIQGYRWGN